MDAWTKDKIAGQGISRDRNRYGKQMQEIHIHQSNHTVSWKVYGKGVANLRASAGISGDGTPVISLNVSETLLAHKNHDAKRDVEKEVYFSLYGPAALELFKMLREAFEPNGPK